MAYVRLKLPPPIRNKFEEFSPVLNSIVNFYSILVTHFLLFPFRTNYFASVTPLRAFIYIDLYLCVCVKEEEEE